MRCRGERKIERWEICVRELALLACGETWAMQWTILWGHEFPVTTTSHVGPWELVSAASLSRIKSRRCCSQLGDFGRVGHHLCIWCS